MTRSVPSSAVAFIQGAEALRLTCYRDSAGVWTIGYGHTGLAIVAGLSITADQASAYLASDLAIAAARLAQVVTAAAINKLSEHEYGALISFVFNLGAGASWHIWALVNAGSLDAVPAEMMRFDKAHVNGQLVTVPGLIHRRMAEVDFWKTGDVGAAATVQSAPVQPPPSSYTRAVETPPTPDPTAKPLVKSKTLWTAAGTAAAGLVSSGQYVLGIAQPLKDNAHLIAQCAEYASVAVVAGGVLIGAFRFMDERAKHQ